MVLPVCSMPRPAAGKLLRRKREAKYELKDFLSTMEQDDAGFVGTSYNGQDDNPNALDGGIATEFIHFGSVHPDTGKKFPHNKFDPDNRANSARRSRNYVS